MWGRRVAGRMERIYPSAAFIGWVLAKKGLKSDEAELVWKEVEKKNCQDAKIRWYEKQAYMMKYIWGDDDYWAD